VRRALLALGLCLLAACAPARTLVPDAPPPPQEETRTRKPGAHVFWRSGHWAWSAERSLYYWEAGAWDAEREEKLWLPGHWEHVEEGGRSGWVWVDERWEPQPRRRD
jgi:hypothetical protein